ncbi:MAG: hypothetical protein WC997_18680 [Porticoccaceae bacterium]
MKLEDLSTRLNELDAQMQIMRIFLFSVASTHTEKQLLSEEFQQRAEGLFLLWRMASAGMRRLCSVVSPGTIAPYPPTRRRRALFLFSSSRFSS